MNIYNVHYVHEANSHHCQRLDPSEKSFQSHLIKYQQLFRNKLISGSTCCRKILVTFQGQFGNWSPCQTTITRPERRCESDADAITVKDQTCCCLLRLLVFPVIQIQIFTFNLGLIPKGGVTENSSQLVNIWICRYQKKMQLRNSLNT